ncbi:MAG: AAA family ATPase, partial [Nitratireductor sp.]
VVVLDGHVVIDSSQGLTFIPVEVFERIGPELIVFVSGDAEVISAQRNEDITRLRPRRSPAELRRQQTAAHDWAKELASRLGISFKMIEAGEIVALKDILNDMQGKT